MQLRIVQMLALAFFVSATARADTITPRQITGGQLVTNFVTGQFEVSGQGFDLQGRTDVSTVPCHPCAGGETVTFSAFNEVRTLSGTVDGVFYPNLFLGGSFRIPSALNVGATGSLVVPSGSITGAQLSFPFATLAGTQLVGFLDTDTTHQTPIFNLPLTGNGVATATLVLNQVLSDGRPLFSASQIAWSFGTAAASPTPEPATVVLFGTGIGAVLISRARRRRQALR